jgi:spore maturation protein CgeB
MIKDLRVLVLDTYYPAFLAGHYDACRGLDRCPYEEQRRALLARRFGTSDVYSHHLRKVGHEATEIIANCVPLQVTWVREHGEHSRLLRAARKFLPGPARNLARRRLLREIALAQVKAFDPEILYVQDLWFLKTRDLDRLREQKRVVVGQIASGLPPEQVLRRYDLLLSSFPHFVDDFRRRGLQSEYFKIGFDERVLDQVRPTEERRYEVTFVGGLDPELHGARMRLLERLAGEVELSAWGYGAEKLAADSPVRRAYRGQAWGLEMYEVLARSRITLNRHIELANGYANNMRLYEATGMGAMLMTEEAANLGELFEPGREVSTYANDDVVAKVRHYLAHEDERRAIASAGKARTLREHTYGERIRELAGILEDRARRGAQ